MQTNIPISIDMSSIVFGSRAIKRCLNCLLEEVNQLDGVHLDLLYIDYKNQKDKRFPAELGKITEKVIAFPTGY